MLVVPVVRPEIFDGSVRGRAAEVAAGAAALGGKVLAVVLAPEGDATAAAEAWTADRLSVAVVGYAPAESGGLTRETWDAFAERLRAACDEASEDQAKAPSWLVVCEDLPNGAPKNAWNKSIIGAKEAGIKVAVDLEGKPLTAALAGGGDLVRVDASHAAVAFDHPNETEIDTIWLAAQYDFGLDGRMVCLSGDESVVLVDGEGNAHSSPVTGPIDRDSLLAALTMTLTGGIDPDTALMLAVGSASPG